MAEKAKLTKAQIDAMCKALSHYGDTDYLVDIHRRMMNQGHTWSIWTALNELTPNELHNALNYGYEVDEQSSPPAFQEKISNNMKAFYGMPIRILRGQLKGVVLPITFIRNDAKVFEIGNEHFFRTCDIGDYWEFVDQQPAPGSKSKAAEPPTHEELEAELDYELASLYDALEQGDANEIERCKQRLGKIQKELEGMA